MLEKWCIKSLVMLVLKEFELWCSVVVWVIELVELIWFEGSDKNVCIINLFRFFLIMWLVRWKVFLGVSGKLCLRVFFR